MYFENVNINVFMFQGNESEKILNKDISYLINKNLSDFDALKNPEVNEFRWKMKALCDEEVKKRASWVCVIFRLLRTVHPVFIQRLFVQRFFVQSY